jgi:hypothetical protein
MLRELRKLCLLAIGALAQDKDMTMEKAETAFSSSSELWDRLERDE